MTTTKCQVLVVDDDEQLCALVRATLELEGFEVREAGHVIEAEKAILERVPDAVVLDVGLPGIDGLFYTQRLRESPRTKHLPIVVISGSAQTEQLAADSGASAYLRKPFDPLELLALLQRLMGATSQIGSETPGLRNILEAGRRQRELADEANRQTLVALGIALNSRDFGSSDHSERVAAYASRLTLELEPALIDDPSLEWGFLLHDVGNIGLPDRILHKPGALTPEERLELEQHPILGEQILAALPLLQGEGLKVVRSHHERWDGTGYPDRLAGTDIPVGARIFAAVDALDAMTDLRPYRTPVGWEEAIEELRRNAGTQFDPDVIDGVVACEPDLHAIRHPSLRPAAHTG
jgi:response regulator RpfG family c-di-GMP phosphodiesterase